MTDQDDLNNQQSADADALANRLRKRQRHLRKWARRTGVSCYRLYERDIPEHPLIVDWYAGEAVVWLYERKRDESPADSATWAATAIEAVQAGLDLQRQQLFVKERFRQTDEASYERLDRAEAVRIVDEQGLRFEVNLSDYVDTGIFLDHRITRDLVRQGASGKRFLNLFAYTGAFTCYAIDGGARRTTTVDLSKTYCDWARRNLLHNGVAESGDHRVLQVDCLLFLEEEIRSRSQYDLIVCDPPTFSASKRMANASFAVNRDHPDLINQCAQLMSVGGVLYFSTNSRRFRLAEHALPSSLQIEEISAQTVPEDFRNTRIHRCWRMTRVH